MKMHVYIGIMLAGALVAGLGAIGVGVSPHRHAHPVPVAIAVVGLGVFLAGIALSMFYLFVNKDR